MNCHEIQDHLSEYLDDLLADPVKLQIDQHMVVCKECQYELTIWQQNEELIFSAKDIPEISVKNGSIADQVMARIKREEKSIPGTIRLNRRLKRWGILVSLLMFVVFSIGLTYTPVVEPSPLVLNEPWESMEVSNSISSVSSAENSSNSVFAQANEKGDVFASIEETMIFSLNESSTNRDNGLFKLSLLGIVLCILSMNWFTRKTV